MAPITIRKAIGAVKDQTSISIAKVAGAVAPDLEVLIVKATSHDDDPTDEKYIREILNLTSHSKGYVNAFVSSISKRLSRTRDWIVALKALMLTHKLLINGDYVLRKEIMYASSRGAKILNMSDFRDEAHPYSWDHSDFVKTYALYLDQKLEFLLHDRKKYGDGYDDFREESYYGNSRSNDYSNRGSMSLDEMKPERILERLNLLLKVLDRFLICKPTGCAKSSKMVLVALHLIVKDSFNLYLEICDVLGVLLDLFQEMDYANCVTGFDAYANAAKKIDDLVTFYSWCKDIGIAHLSDYPKVQKITANLLGTLERCLRDRGNRLKKADKKKEDSFSSNMNEIKSLPPPLQAQSRAKPKTEPMVTNDLLDLSGLDSVEEQSNKLALALFSGPLDSNSTGSWEPFGESSSKGDWELALVESSSNLSKQKVDMGGKIDFLLLDGMYDHGAIKQNVGNSGSASSVVANNGPPVLALPGPVDQEDPFAASLMVPPPSYVQIVDLEKKQHLLAQEQRIWQQYESSGMQGQLSFDKILSSGGGGGYSGSAQFGGGYYYRTPF